MALSTEPDAGSARLSIGAAGAAALGRSEVGWALFQAGRDPYVVLCTVYVLAPYIATTVIGDGVAGQTMIAQWNTVAGILVALTAPFLGSIADALGRRKPPLGMVTLLMAAGIFALWWSVPPEMPGLSIQAIGALVIMIAILFAWTEVLHNSMLPSASSPATLPLASGVGHALGSAISVALLIFVLWGFAFPGRIDLPGVPSAPLFGLDPLAHEPSRIVAPIVAVLFLLLSLPMFLFSRDAAPSGMAVGAAARSGVKDLIGTVRTLFSAHRNAAIYLIARMLYTDGKTALLLFGGIVAAGVLGWGLVEMTAYGIIMSVFAVLGGLSAAKLDTAIGPRNAIIAEIGITTTGLLGLGTIAQDRIFMIPVEPGVAVWGAPIFSTLPELVFIGMAAMVAVAITAAYSSSRTMLTRVSPPGLTGQFFGLYALAGAATAWLGPLLVGITTAISGNQQVGLVSILILLLAGLALMFKVEPTPPTPTAA